MARTIVTIYLRDNRRFPLPAVVLRSDDSGLTWQQLHVEDKAKAHQPAVTIVKDGRAVLFYRNSDQTHVGVEAWVHDPTTFQGRTLAVEDIPGSTHRYDVDTGAIKQLSDGRLLFCWSSVLKEDGRRAPEKRVKLLVTRPDALEKEASPSLKDLKPPLKAEGGVGHKSWSVAAGTLPHGLRLSPSGMLYGTPGEEGEFPFTMRVEDSYPAGSRSADSQLKLVIGPADSKTLLVKKALFKTVELDGQLSESFWTMDQPVAVKVRGEPVKQALFTAVWEEQERQQGKAQNLWLAVKVLDGLAGKSKTDGVHLYLDGRHNREVIYNSDDTHVFLPRDGWPRALRGKPEWFFQSKVTEIDGGYLMEICVGSTYFIGEGNPVDFGAKAVDGFDLAVEEEAGRQAWRGNEKVDEDTSVFGTIVLLDEQAGSKQ